jgi:hypothetical protein
MNDLIKKAQEETKMLRQIGLENKIIVICEHAQYKNLRDGFKFACHSIIEKIDENTFLVRKNREAGDGYQISLEDVNKLIVSSEFQIVIFVINKDMIINARVSDMIFPDPVSNWYYKNRGLIYGTKFGL